MDTLLTFALIKDTISIYLHTLLVCMPHEFLFPPLHFPLPYCFVCDWSEGCLDVASKFEHLQCIVIGYYLPSKVEATGTLLRRVETV